jgi:hypothetical protein
MDLRKLQRQEFEMYIPVLIPAFRSGYYGCSTVNKDVSKRSWKAPKFFHYGLYMCLIERNKSVLQRLALSLGFRVVTQQARAF